MTIIQHSHFAARVLVGKPVIRGTRLSVEFVIGLMADGARPISSGITRGLPTMTLSRVWPMRAIR